jgi:adenylate kinase family enzyme
MTLQTFIIIGRSGSGKGTQADLLQEYIKKRDPKTEILYAESGDEFREFLKSDNYASRLAKEINTKGLLQPAFLAIWIWSSYLIKNLNNEKHLILDGTPRKLNEAYVLDEAFSFYKRSNVNVIYINVSVGWATDRLKSRHRLDDTDKGIKKRLDWFDTETMEAVDFYKNNPNYNFFDINGEQSVEGVYQEIVSKLKA